MRWIPLAMVRVAAALTAGILIGVNYPNFMDLEQTVIVLVLLVFTYFLLFFFLRGSRSIRNLSGIIGLSSVFLAGFVNVSIKNESHLPDHLLNQNDSIVAYVIRITGVHEEKEKSWKRVGSIESVLTAKGWKKSRGNVNLYWPRTEFVSHLDYGDKLIILNHPIQVNPPLNPHEFDYQKFLAYRNIFHQHYIKHGEWSLVEKSDEHGLLFYAQRARAWSIHAIKKHIHDQRQQAIVVAFVIGSTDGIDDELQGAYAANGAMHALAVSGLHVSIIYGILLFFFQPLKKIKNGDWIIAILSLIILWTYAFTTGLSPSVLRAVTMFSFMAVAKPFSRSTNIYNTLAASAFILLVYDPFLILSVGFQLSYLAVLGIVYLYRPIYNLWAPVSLFMNWIWQITCISIAAQVATLPLTLFYFHQFPVYFLLSNLFVIPGSFIILVAGLVLIALSPFVMLAEWLGIALEWFVKIFNDCIFIVESLPLSLINGLYITSWQSIFLAVMTIFALLLLERKRFRFLIMTFLSGMVIGILSWENLMTNSSTSDWTVYAIKGHSAMEWRNGTSAKFMLDSTLINDPEKIRYHILPNLLVQGVNADNAEEPVLIIENGLRLLGQKGRIFMWIPSGKFKLPNTIRVECLVISHNAIRSIREIMEHVRFRNLIFDGTNSFHYIKRMEGEAKKLKIPCSFVLKDGSFTLKL